MVVCVYLLAWKDILEEDSNNGFTVIILNTNPSFTFETIERKALLEPQGNSYPSWNCCVLVSSSLLYGTWEMRETIRIWNCQSIHDVYFLAFMFTDIWLVKMEVTFYSNISLSISNLEGTNQYEILTFHSMLVHWPPAKKWELIWRLNSHWVLMSWVSNRLRDLANHCFRVRIGI